MSRAMDGDIYFAMMSNHKCYRDLPLEKILHLPFWITVTCAGFSLAYNEYDPWKKAKTRKYIIDTPRPPNLPMLKFTDIDTQVLLMK